MTIKLNQSMLLCTRRNFYYATVLLDRITGRARPSVCLTVCPVQKSV